MDDDSRGIPGMLIEWRQFYLVANIKLFANSLMVRNSEPASFFQSLPGEGIVHVMYFLLALALPLIFLVQTLYKH
jgi:hypothetical protein